MGNTYWLICLSNSIVPAGTHSGDFLCMGFEIAFHGARISRSFPVIQVIAAIRWLWKFQNKGTIVHADNFACISQLCRVVVSSQPVCSLHGGLIACAQNSRSFHMGHLVCWVVWFCDAFGMRFVPIILFAKYWFLSVPRRFCSGFVMSLRQMCVHKQLCTSWGGICGVDADVHAFVLCVCPRFYWCACRGAFPFVFSKLCNCDVGRRGGWSFCICFWICSFVCVRVVCLWYWFTRFACSSACPVCWDCVKLTCGTLSRGARRMHSCACWYFGF